MIVIYVEKKSAAKSIAEALNAGQFKKKKDLTKKKLGILGYWNFYWNDEETYIIYGVGHLTELYSAKDYDSKYEEWSLSAFPCVPERFKTKPSEGTIDYYNLAKELFSKADLIISATDPDREGQVVFDYLYKTTGVKTPWKRAWLPSDLTPAKIRKAFDNLEDWSVHYPLTLAGNVRSISDWLIGINLTVASTLKFGGKTLMNEGRVQTTVLNMIVQRTREIESFKPESFWKIAAEITVSDGMVFNANLVEPTQFDKKEEAEALLKKLNAVNEAIIVDKISKRRTLKKPLLFSTTELQIAVNKKYGYDVTQIAAEMEALYNNHYITYPRTNAVVLSNSLENETRNNIKKLFSTERYKKYFRTESKWSPFTDRHFDDFLIKKSEDSHTAVVPTTVIPDFSKLTLEQRNIYDMIARSIICLAYDDVEVEDTTLEIKIGGYAFKASGSVELNYSESWHRVIKDESDNSLPNVKVGDRFSFNPSINEGKTKAPSYFTQASLLKAMTYANRLVEDEDVSSFMKSAECGLGTGGTRPEIVGGLIKNKLIAIEKKHLVPTDKGYWLIDHIPNELKMIKDVATTGKWEQMLSVIATSDLKTAVALSAKFTNRISDATRLYFKAIADAPSDYFSDTDSGKKLDGSIYNCPKCGKPLKKFDWGYGCTGRNDGCKFALGSFRNKKLTEKQMTDLLEKGKTGKMTFTSNKDTKYQGYLAFDENNNIKFNFANSKKKEG